MVGELARTDARTERRVLVVEDDRDVSDAVSEALEDAGYGVVVADHGASALEMLRALSQPPGLILLDLMMPVMDGERFLQEFRKVERWAAVPIVVLTADGRATTKAATLGACCGLRKPVQLDDLLATVARYWRPD